ncbi:MAG: hypothetical protein AAB692_01100, partial [Patescibacteria group bacterium]
MNLKQDVIRDHLKTLRRRLARPGVFNAIYAFLTLLILAGIGFSLFKFLSFSVRMVNQATAADDGSAASGQASFDIAGLIRL